MQPVHSIAAASALALLLALAPPALAQQAASPARPASAGADDAVAQAAPQPGQRQISGRELMTPEERRNFRRQMQQASPEQRQVLLQQKLAELEQRAAGRIVVLPEPGRRADGNARRDPAEARPGEAGGAVIILLTRLPPRAP